MCTNESSSEACLRQDNNQLSPLPVGSYFSYSKDIRLNLALCAYGEQCPPLASRLAASRLITFNYLLKEITVGEREKHTHTQTKGETALVIHFILLLKFKQRNMNGAIFFDSRQSRVTVEHQSRDECKIRCFASDLLPGYCSA